jgi:hypothetical protein
MLAEEPHKTVIIDSNWELLDTEIFPTNMKWKDLNHKRAEYSHPLQEKPVDFRPAARYLHFHYCFHMLRSTKETRPETDMVQLLRDEMGKHFWGWSIGRYMPRNMLKGLVGELRHEYKDIFRAASFSVFGSVEKDCPLKLQEFRPSKVTNGDDDERRV